VAVNCPVTPAAAEALAGVTEIEVNTAVPVHAAEPLMVPEVAVMVALPGATQVTKPLLLFTVATEGADDVQVAVLVRFWVAPLL